MALSAENNPHNISGEPSEIQTDTADNGDIIRSISENGYINVIGSSGTVYLSRKTDDPLLGETDRLIPGQSEDPMTID
jgi:hypothetical protein